ncbi:MAG: magnesium transporter [Phycisphaerae bacterium]
MDGPEGHIPPDPHDVDAVCDLLRRDRRQLGDRLRVMHPSDIADLVSAMPSDEKADLFALLAPRAAADVLAELDPESREDVVESARPESLRLALAELEPDQAADVIGSLEPEEAVKALKGVEDPAEVRALLAYAPDSAGGLMTTEFVVLPRDSTVHEALERARGGSETTHRDYLYVTDSAGRPVGRLPLAKLVFSPPDAKVQDIMEPDVHAVPTDMDREQVAEIVRRYDLLSVPVVDPQTGIVMGIVTVDDVLDAAADEAAEDMYRLAGTGATDPLHQPILKRATLRLPWLLITLVPGFLVGHIMRWLGYDPGGTTALLLFVPVMIEMAGNVSLQSSTIMVRGLATGDVRAHRTLTILGNEVAVAALVGVVCGALSGLVGYAFFDGEVGFAVVIAFSMLCGILSAAVSGTLIPLACDRVGVDPALASGPFVTSLNDITGTLIYLGLGARLLGLFH